MKKVAIIPARGGSIRIPRKNIKDFFGHPVLAYSIIAAEKSGLFDKIYVSTEDEEIAEIAKKYGAAVIKRSQDLARNEVGTQEVVKNALRQIEPYDYVCCIYATSPLIDIHDLKRGLSLLESNRNINYAFSVGTEPLHDAGCFYWMKTEAVLNDKPLFSENSIMVPISADRVCDINTQEDWDMAEKKYQSLRIST